MLSFHIQSNKHPKPKQIHVRLSKCFQGLTHFHVLTSMLHTCSVVLLFAVQESLSAFDTCVTVCLSSFGFDLHVCTVLRHRLPGSVRLPAPPTPSPQSMYVESRRIKLKALDYPSQRSGDSDPISAEDKHMNQATQNEDDSSLS